MISFKQLFENFRLPFQYKISSKKVLPATPTNMFASKISKIKRLNSKLLNLNNRIQRWLIMSISNPIISTPDDVYNMIKEGEKLSQKIPYSHPKRQMEKL